MKLILLMMVILFSGCLSQTSSYAPAYCSNGNPKDLIYYTLDREYTNASVGYHKFVINIDNFVFSNSKPHLCLKEETECDFNNLSSCHTGTSTILATGIETHFVRNPDGLMQVYTTQSCFGTSENCFLLTTPGRLGYSLR